MNNSKNNVNEPYFGSSPMMERVKRYASIAASARCPVLILGESGTGKGVFARWIHDHSARRNRAFVDINCSGLTGALLKSELFGHARGAFTGAVSDRSGLIEDADGGTLFLDEIGDMEVSVQCLLLKAVEEKFYRRVGENRPRTSNFRLICATNRNLAEAMEKGKFREDLYYRINTLTVNLPSLRERSEDIPGLLNHLLARMDYARFPVDPVVADTLALHCWRGNIRELRNTLERALVLARGEALAAEHFADIIGNTCPKADEASAELEVAEPQAEYEAEQAADNTLNLQTMEAAHIRRALERFDGDKAKACEALGISLSTLYRKLDLMED